MPKILLDENGKAIGQENGAAAVNNLIPENIKKDATILGVTGTYTGEKTSEVKYINGISESSTLTIPVDKEPRWLYIYGSYVLNSYVNFFARVASSTSATYYSVKSGYGSTQTSNGGSFYVSYSYANGMITLTAKAVEGITPKTFNGSYLAMIIY